MFSFCSEVGLFIMIVTEEWLLLQPASSGELRNCLFCTSPLAFIIHPQSLQLGLIIHLLLLGKALMNFKKTDHNLVKTFIIRMSLLYRQAWHLNCTLANKHKSMLVTHSALYSMCDIWPLAYYSTISYNQIISEVIMNLPIIKRSRLTYRCNNFVKGPLPQTTHVYRQPVAVPYGLQMRGCVSLTEYMFDYSQEIKLFTTFLLYLSQGSVCCQQQVCSHCLFEVWSKKTRLVSI